MSIRELIPPVLLKWRDDLRQRPIFASYQEALRHCDSRGYEEEDLVTMVLEKTRRYRDRVLSEHPFQLDSTIVPVVAGVMWTLQRCRTTELRVLDFGGGCGAHYFTVKALFGTDVRFRWHVVETPAMSRRAQELADDELQFFESLVEAKAALDGVDLTHSSGAIQCVPDPYQILRDLVACRGRFLLLGRLGLTRGDHKVVTVHVSRLGDNGPGPFPGGYANRMCRHPFTFAAKKEVDDIIGAHYDVRLQLDDASGVFRLGSERVAGLAYLAERRAV